MLGYVNKHKIMYVYVEHGHTTVGTSNEHHMNKTFEIIDFIENVNVVSSYDLEVRQSSDESDFEDREGDTEDESKSGNREANVEDIVDEEHIIDEVEVNMSGFKFEFDGEESDLEDLLENARSKALRKLSKKNASSGIRNNFYVGNEFVNKDVAKDRIRAYLVESIRNIDFKKNDKERIRVICNGVVSSLSSKDAFFDKVQEKFHVGVSKIKTFKEKAKARVHLREDANVQYSMLRDYVSELQRRIYVCLGALKKGLKAGGRESLSLDGPFIRGQYPE
ncbi:hypothetical protein Tco_0169122 [Tanacetum coccineum]